MNSIAGLEAPIAGLALDVIDWPMGPKVKEDAELPIEWGFELGIFYGPMIAFF